MRNLTATDFLRIRTCDAFASSLSNSVLTAAARMAQVEVAKACRNFWFTSTLQSKKLGSAAGVGTVDKAGLTSSVISVTPRFSTPIIITDILSLYEPCFASQNSNAEPTVFTNMGVDIQQYGGEGNAYGRDFFGVYDVPLLSWLVLSHERNRTNLTLDAQIEVPELMDKRITFVPHLLRPYESLRVTYSLARNFIINFAIAMPHIGVRGVRALSLNNPYANLSALARQQVMSYINGSDPDTFLMEVRTPLASLGAINTGFVELRTPQQGRPLFILGAASNVDGCQVRVTDESGYYQFTFQEKPDPTFTAAQSYTDPPLALVAPNTDYRNTDLFNMWPVPHFLEPNTVLRIRLNNGCFPGIQSTGGLLQAASTRNDQDVRITFLCRTP